MAGTKAGGAKAATTNKERHGSDYYRNLGRKGGTISRGGGFASDKVGADGLTGPERAKIVGVKGGRAGKGILKPRMKKEVENEAI